MLLLYGPVTVSLIAVYFTNYIFKIIYIIIFILNGLIYCIILINNF